MARREAWKVMTWLQKIYRSNHVQSIAEVRYKLGNLKMGADQNPTILFCELATLEHAYSHTKGRITDDDMIGTIFAVTPEKYQPTLNMVAEPRCQPEAKPPRDGDEEDLASEWREQRYQYSGCH